MKHEPGYVSGTYSLPALGVHAGWVAHAGSYAASQPASREPGGPVLLFSGECYSSAGTVERPPVPAGVEPAAKLGALLDDYERHGSSFVGKLNGLFSGLLIDPNQQCALLFNDRFGCERIYTYENNGVTYFASEAKALLRVLPELRAFDDDVVAEFLTYGSVQDGRTLFRGIRLLPAASLWSFGDGLRPSKHRYFQPGEWESQPELSRDAFEAAFEEVFRRVLPRYLASDTPVGIAITGGLDTRMIMACLSERPKGFICYTFAGPTGETLDVQVGRRVAEACGVEHQTLRVDANFLAEYGRHVDRTVFVTDACAGALGAHEIYLTAQARQLAPVRLTGNYGSEVLRSVSTFKPLELTDALFDPSFRRLLLAARSRGSGGRVHPVTHAAFREIPWHLFGTLAAGRSQLAFRTPYLDNEIVKLAYAAPASSRHSPRAALQLIEHNNRALGRIPTDRGLMCGAHGPGNAFRRLFAEVTFKLDYLHKEGLPHYLSHLDALLGSLAGIGLIGLHKFLAYRRWYRQELAGYVREVLMDSHTQQMPYWDGPYLRSIVTEHIAGRRNYVQEIHAVLTLEAAERLLLRGTA